MINKSAYSFGLSEVYGPLVAAAGVVPAGVLEFQQEFLEFLEFQEFLLEFQSSKSSRTQFRFKNTKFYIITT